MDEQKFSNNYEYMLNESNYNLNIDANHIRIMRRLALFLSILLSGGMLLFPRIPLLVMVVILSLLVSGGRLVSLHRMWRLVVLLLVILVIALVRPGSFDLESLAVRYANFICAVLLLNTYIQYSSSVFKDDLRFILELMAWQAIVTFTFANTFEFIFQTVNTDDGSSIKTLLFLLNYHDVILDSTSFIRPDGFFYEPGVFQLYLNIYLYLMLYIYESRKHTVLAILAVLTTQSTTGIVIALILLGVALFKNIKIYISKGKLFGLILLATTIPPMLYTGYVAIDEKLNGESQGSAWAREYDFYTGIDLIKDNPLVGIGFDHKRYISESARWRYNYALISIEDQMDRQTSNGIFFLFYSLGIPTALVFVFGMFRQIFFRDRILFGLLLGLSLFSESIVFTPFILMLIFSGFISN
jgi:hypothetical protein